jgi:hypothetical protein
MRCGQLTCEGSGEWGLNVIRTIWPGFTFLIVLAGVGSFRFAFGHFDAANASGIVRLEGDRTVGTKAVQDTFTNTERLRVAYVAPAPDDVDLANVNQIPAGSLSRTSPTIVTPRIISRHEPVAAGSRHLPLRDACFTNFVVLNV